jgi:hypothetical protein
MHIYTVNVLKMNELLQLSLMRMWARARKTQFLNLFVYIERGFERELKKRKDYFQQLRIKKNIKEKNSED